MRILVYLTTLELNIKIIDGEYLKKKFVCYAPKVIRGDCRHRVKYRLSQLKLKIY